MYAVILAGGSGTRLWPVSRRKTPKQFLRLWDTSGKSRTLLQATFDRIRLLVDEEQVLIVAGPDHQAEIIKQLPELPKDNLLIEPQGKGSAPAVGLAAVDLDKRGAGDEVLFALPADHVIREEEKFRSYLASAAEVAKEGLLVTLGVVPTRPETGYGYILRGELLGEFAGHQAYSVQRFLEKPGEETARRFLDTGEYYWNSGNFVWQVSRLLEEIKRLMPDLDACLQKIAMAWGTPQETKVLAENWTAIAPQTIDYGIMEKSEKVAVLPMEVGWSDVGNWTNLWEIMPQDEEGNVIVGKQINRGSRRSLVYSPRKTVATIGIEDLIIVDTEDAILICPRDRAQEVKALVEKLSKEGWEDLL